MVLPNNELTRIPCSVGNLIALKHLDLRGNALTRVPQSLSKLSKLENLYLIDSHVCRECVPEQLRAITKFC